MNNNGAYTHNLDQNGGGYWQHWGGIFTRNGRNYFFEFGNNNNANGGYVHHRFKMGGNWNVGVTDAYRVSPECLDDGDINESG